MTEVGLWDSLYAFIILLSCQLQSAKPMATSNFWCSNMPLGKRNVASHVLHQPLISGRDMIIASKCYRATTVPLSHSQHTNWHLHWPSQTFCLKWIIQGYLRRHGMKKTKRPLSHHIHSYHRYDGHLCLFESGTCMPFKKLTQNSNPMLDIAWLEEK